MKCFEGIKGFKGVDEVYRISAHGNDVKGVIFLQIQIRIRTSAQLHILSTQV